jgi:glycosyltransferase involved in cell wall biosynthesis
MGWVDTPFVFFLDDDDLLEPTFLETTTLALLSNPWYAHADTFINHFGAKNATERNTWFAPNLKQNSHVSSQLVRVSVLRELFGDGRPDGAWPRVFNESMVGGGEDWDLWCRLKAAGHDGFTVPAPLFWYRMKEKRRKWNFLDTSNGKTPEDSAAELRDTLEIAHPKLFSRGFTAGWESGRLNRWDCRRGECPFAPAAAPFPMMNRHLGRPASCNHAVLVIPWLALGGADQFNVDIIKHLATRSWTFTVVTTYDIDGTSEESPSLNWILPLVRQYTDDVLVMPHFLLECTNLQFLLYLVRSRNANVVMTSNSHTLYTFAPFLKRRLPGVAFVDLVHMHEPNNVGGFPKMSADMSPFFDLSLFVSADEMRHVSTLAGFKGKQNKKHEILYAGVDVSATRTPVTSAQREAIRASFNVPPDVTLILFSGRLVEQKKPLMMLRVFERAVKTMAAMAVRVAALKKAEAKLAGKPQATAAAKVKKAGVSIEPMPRVGAWRSFTEGRAYVQGLKLGSKKEWETWRTSGQRPASIPASPQRTYRDDGWVSWPDWLGNEERGGQLFGEGGTETERVHLVIVGNGPMRKSMKGFLNRRADLKRSVTMLGTLTHERLMELTSAADIFFMPSKTEGIPVAMIEAMAARVVCVATRVGGVPELITGPTIGLLHHENDARGMAASLVQLVREPERRRAMGANARQRVIDHFSTDVMRAALMRHFDKAVTLAHANARRVADAADDDVAAEAAYSPLLRSAARRRTMHKGKIMAMIHATCNLAVATFVGRWPGGVYTDTPAIPNYARGGAMSARRPLAPWAAKIKNTIHEEASRALALSDILLPDAPPDAPWISAPPPDEDSVLGVSFDQLRLLINEPVKKQGQK